MANRASTLPAAPKMIKKGTRPSRHNLPPVSRRKIASLVAKVKLHQMDQQSQIRLCELMTINNDGALSPTERQEFQALGRLAQELTMKNARLLAAAAKPKQQTTVQKVSRRQTSASKPKAD